MCVTITVGDVDCRAPIWSRPEVTIIISGFLTAAQGILQIRAMLMWLGAPQSSEPATCWCGDPVELPYSAKALAGSASERVVAHTSGR
jgi:hypothetical protein